MRELVMILTFRLIETLGSHDYRANASNMTTFDLRDA